MDRWDALPGVAPDGTRRLDRVVGPGDLEKSALLEDVTEGAIFQLRTDVAADYFLDDHSLFERPHHWEVKTKIEILASKDIKRLLGRLNERPASFWELELILKRRKTRELDQAIYWELQKHQFAETYIAKTKQMIAFNENDMSLIQEDPIDPASLSESELLVSLRQAHQIVKQLEIDVKHRENEYAVYLANEKRGRFETFGYLAALQKRLLQLGRNGLMAKAAELLALTKVAQQRKLI